MARLSKKTKAEMYQRMLHIRKFEEKISYFFSMGMVHGTTHLYIGEEAVAVGACTALGDEDLITSTHRGHGHCIANGIDLNRMMAEFLGKSAGYCKGKGGSMHIADLASGNLGANGVVGGGIPIATGAGLSLQMQKKDAMVLCFFGDGATNEGSFHEAVNLASIWKLPVLFLCENNLYGMSMHVKKHANVPKLADRAAAYGIPGQTVDGNDLLAVYDAVAKARKYVKKNGPMLLVAETYRWLGHSKSDANRYRSKEEIADWKTKCPIKRFRRHLLQETKFSESELAAMEKMAEQDIEAAVAYADSCAYPELESIYDDVYA
jgi:TPP-dependent pyruvate/acetoin dehydrogenase alpha subunit